MKFKYKLGLSSVVLGAVASVGFVPKTNQTIKHEANGVNDFLDKIKAKLENFSKGNIVKNVSNISLRANYIFEDSKKNLWSAGFDTGLQVLRNGKTTGEAAGNGNNITDGYFGFMFEDSKKNLWSAGNRTGLQVLRKDKTRGEAAGNGNNITDGGGGFMFEDSKKNLWSAGRETGLQVLRNGKTNGEAAGNGNNIVNGELGFMFEDSKKNLWSAGNRTGLQVLRKDKTRGETPSGNNITNGGGGFMFEDSKKNLWSAGRETGLQVLRNGQTNGEVAGNGNNITDSTYGFMFEDSKGNLWSSGGGSILQSTIGKEILLERINEGITKLEDNNNQISEDKDKTLSKIEHLKDEANKLIKDNNILEANNDKNFINTTGGILFISLLSLLEVSIIGFFIKGNIKKRKKVKKNIKQIK